MIFFLGMSHLQALTMRLAMLSTLRVLSWNTAYFLLRRNPLCLQNRRRNLWPSILAFRRCSLYRRSLLVGVLSLGLVFFLSGCQKPATQNSTDTGSDNSSSSNAASPSDSSSASSSSSTAPGSSSRRAVAEVRPIVIPADTEVTVVLDESLGSKDSSSGQSFSASLRAPVEVNGEVVIPRDARITGLVREAKSAGRFKGGAELSLELTGVNIRGRDYDLHTEPRTWVTKGKGKRTAVLVGGGGALGALIGGLAGGGKGAAIGAAAGAGAGAGGAGLTGNRDITLPAETPVSFKLAQSLEIRR
jgi:hypothetical protein